MSHWFREKNLWFQRQENGDVRIVTDQSDSNFNRSEPDFTSITSDHTVDVHHWISDILNLTVFSEQPLYWGRMVAHHQGTHDYLSDNLQIEAFKEGFQAGQNALIPNTVKRLGMPFTSNQEITKLFYKWRYRPNHHP